MDEFERERRKEKFRKAEAKVWEAFELRLNSAKSLNDVELLLSEAPPPDSAGRRFYSNLGFFVQNFALPDGAGSLENEMYIKLLERLRDGGEVESEKSAQVERALRSSMAAKARK